MKKKVFLLTIALMMAFTTGVMASSAIKVVVNGQTASVDAKLIDNRTYVPLRAVSEMLGANVQWDQKTRTVNITSKDIPVNSETVKTVDGITTEITKVEQDSDSLRIHVTYTNNTESKIHTAESLAKVVANGRQYEYNSDFNFTRYYNTGAAKAADSLEPGVTEESIIYFEPISNVGKINIVLSPHFKDIRFNNINVSR